MSEESYSEIPKEFGDTLEHYGIIRKSGRYPWGSGKDPFQRSAQFYNLYHEMRSKGLTDKQIAQGLGLIEEDGYHKGEPSLFQLRATLSLAKNETIKHNMNIVRTYGPEGKQWSVRAIHREFGIPETTIRNYIDKDKAPKVDKIQKTAQALREDLSKGGYLDVGAGSELASTLGVSPDAMNIALSVLKSEGYKVYVLKQPTGIPGKEVTVRVLAPPGTDYNDLKANKDQLRVPGAKYDRNTEKFEKPHSPISVDKNRVEIIYAEDGGGSRDGLIEIRPGAKDLDLGNSKYAQVRIAVNDTHYAKGVALYNNDLPPGVDMRVHSTKPKGTPMLGTKDNTVLKLMKDDPNDRFGSQIKPGGQKGALNIIYEEGDWEKWSSRLSSQMLSKQSTELAQKQLNLTYEIRRNELEEILEMNNPAVRKKLLSTYADNLDSQSVRLAAHGLPGTRTHVILPIPEMPDNEIYATGYENGQKVALVRHPHGGTFEIPELTVNNRRQKPKSILGQPKDAVGISPKVAEQLSGADFDGDTVLVIPQRPGSLVRNKPPLKQLEGFDPKDLYKIPEGDKTTKRMTRTQFEMGSITNLISDMTILGADDSEIARAVKHSMVVIDAEKHGLDYKQSEIDNDIKSLKKRYQNGGGANTLITRAGSTTQINEVKDRPAAQGGYIDPSTGKVVKVETGREYVKREVSPSVLAELAEKHGRPESEIRKMVQAEIIQDPRVKATVVKNTTKVSKMSATDDARTLMSNGGVGTRMEQVYADHANRLKSLANEARKAEYFTPNQKRDPQAAEKYRPQVDTLVSKIKQAQRNLPNERVAKVIAASEIKAKLQENPWIDKDTRSKIERAAIKRARIKTGASAADIIITDKEWEAIQSGAVSHDRLTTLLRFADLDRVRELALPRTENTIPAPTLARAKAMLANGYTQAEVASALGISVSTVNSLD